MDLSQRFRRLFPMRLHQASQWVWSIVRYLLVIGISFVILYPVLFMASNAFKSQADMADTSVIWIPKQATWDNLLAAFHVMDYPQAFANSLQLALIVSVLNVLCCTLVGYGFARFAFRGRSLLFALVIATLVIPPHTIMIPQYLHFRFFDLFGIIEAITGRPGVNILDSYWPFILQSLTGMGLKNGLYILIFRQFFRGLPAELEEAALVDGAGTARTFYSVMLPNALPAITTVFLFSFVWQWNDSYFTTLYLQNTNVLPLALGGLSANVGAILGLTSMNPFMISVLNNAGSLLVIAPLIVLFIASQRAFVEGVERSGLVG